MGMDMDIEIAWRISLWVWMGVWAGSGMRDLGGGCGGGSEGYA